MVISTVDWQQRISYLVCSTPRCGSSLFCDGLAGTEVAGVPDEYFADEPRGAIQKPDWLSQRSRLSASEYIRYLVETRSTDNGVFGGKITAAQMVELTDQLRKEQSSNASRASLLSASLPNLRYIWVARRNKTEQAVSFWRALQSGSYSSRQEGRSKAKPRFSFSLIDHTVDQFVFYERLWGDFFSQARIVPFTVIYEDLVIDYEDLLREAIQFIGLREHPVHLREPNLERQADSISVSWSRRYEEKKRRQRHRKILKGIPHVAGSSERRRVYWARLTHEPSVEDKLPADLPEAARVRQGLA